MIFQTKIGAVQALRRYVSICLKYDTDMNIFKTYVKRNLKANRLRTTMTIAGIILSVALVAAVIEGAFSGIEYVRNVLKDAYL